jgi:hypothetical protein
MARILQQMRNIGDDAHFQEMRNELSKNQASDMDFVPANLPIPGITKS